MAPLEYCIDDLDIVVQGKLIPLFKNKPIVLLKGPLGAGKTTLVRNLLQACGVQGPIVSPTFSYVQTYENDRGEIFHHFDLYRLSDIQSFFSLGLDEMLTQDGVKSLIEWPEIIIDWLVSSSMMTNVVIVTLAYDSDDKQQRLLEIVSS